MCLLTRSKASLCVLLLLGGLFPAASPAAAKSLYQTKCQHFPVSGQGVGFSNGHAKNVAIADWQGKVSIDFGSAYANINKAYGKSFQCHSVSRKTVKCTFEAVPCKEIKHNVLPHPPDAFVAPPGGVMRLPRAIPSFRPPTDGLQLRRR